MNPVQATDPLGGLVEVGLGDTGDLRLGGDTPSVMGLIVDHEQVAGAGDFTEHVADVGLVALGPGACPRYASYRSVRRSPS